MSNVESILVGAVVVLIGKIVWSWLSNRSTEHKNLTSLLLREISTKITFTNAAIEKIEKKFDKFEAEVFLRLRTAESDIKVLNEKVLK